MPKTAFSFSSPLHDLIRDLSPPEPCSGLPAFKGLAGPRLCPNKTLHWVWHRRFKGHMSLSTRFSPRMGMCGEPRFVIPKSAVPGTEEHVTNVRYVSEWMEWNKLIHWCGLGNCQWQRGTFGLPRLRKRESRTRMWINQVKMTPVSLSPLAHISPGQNGNRMSSSWEQGRKQHRGRRSQLNDKMAMARVSTSPG